MIQHCANCIDIKLTLLELINVEKYQYMNIFLIVPYLHLHACVPYYDTNVLDIYIVKCSVM